MWKVLIVEDNMTDVKIMSFILQKKNYEVFVANEVLTAMEILNTYKIDLILLDWMLPHTNGIELLKTLRKDSKRQSVPIFIVSGKNDLKDIKLAIANGATDYILKPIDPLIMQSKIDQVLQQKSEWNLTPLPKNYERSAQLQNQVEFISLSEIGTEVLSIQAYPVGTSFEAHIKFLSELGIDKLNLKVIECKPNGQQFIIKASIVGTKESDLQLIRLFLRTLSLDKAVAA